LVDEAPKELRTARLNAWNRRANLPRATVAVIDANIDAVPKCAIAVAAFTVGSTLSSEWMTLPIGPTRRLHHTIVIYVRAVEHAGKSRPALGFGNARITGSTGRRETVSTSGARSAVATIQGTSTQRDADVAGALQCCAAIRVRITRTADAHTIGATRKQAADTTAKCKCDHSQAAPRWGSVRSEWVEPQRSHRNVAVMMRVTNKV